MSTSFSTPPTFAKKLCVDSKKVLYWIEAGELVAVNVATNPDGRPRWRISDDAIEAFLANRQSAHPSPPVPQSKRRRKSREVVEFL